MDISKLPLDIISTMFLDQEIPEIKNICIINGELIHKCKKILDNNSFWINSCP